MIDQPAFADLVPGVDPQPVSALAEPRRAAYQAALCRIAELAGSLHTAVALAPDNDDLIAALNEQFCTAALVAMSALEDFKTARDCAGSA